MSHPDSGDPGPTLHLFSDALANAVAAVAPSIVAIHARRRIPASGIVWRAGYVIASDHTIRRERDITVTLEDGRQVAATLVGRDSSTDLCLLKIADDTVPAAPRVSGSETTGLRPGHIVLAVGRPGAKVTATLGTVHTVGSEWRTWQGGQISELVRVDMAVHDGFSGSALVDTNGNVVGINSSMLMRGVQASSIVDGISNAVFARSAPASIPVSTIDRVVDQLLSGGRIPRGWLGVGTQPVRLPERVRTDAGLSQEVGLLLVGVAADSPAERASLFVGDTLVSLAGTPTREADDVLAILGPDTVGRTLTARIVRAGSVMEVPVVIGESPHAESDNDRGGRGGSGSGRGGPRGGDGGGERGGPRGDRHHEHRHDEHRGGGRGGRRWEHAFRARQGQSPEEAFEQLRDFAGAFGLGFARGCGPRRPH